MKPQLYYAARVTRMLRAPFGGWRKGVFFRYMTTEERDPHHNTCGPCFGGCVPVDRFRALETNKALVQRWVDDVNREQGLVGVRAELVTFELRELS